MLPGQVIDRELEASIAVDLAADDGVIHSETFEIAVRDVNEFDVSVPKDVDTAPNTVRGSAKPGTKVGVTLAARDADATNNTVAYALVKGSTGFAIDGDNAIVVAKGLTPAGGLLRKLTVRASSSDGSFAEATFDVTIDPKGITVDGEDIDETLVGTAWNDTLRGNGGNDLLRGGSGDDVLDGGAGINTVDFSDRSLRVELTLRDAGAATAKVGSDERDTVSNVQSMIGGSAGDRLIGNYRSNIIAGGPGSDFLDGGPTTSGDPIDVADFSTTPGPVIVSLDVGGNATASTGSGVDTLKRFEDLRGSSKGDTLASARQYTRFEGGPGNDKIKGKGGLFHRVVYTHALNAVKVDLKNGFSCNVKTCSGTEGKDLLENIIWVTGSRAAEGDVIIGNDENNVIDGLQGRIE